MNCWHCNHELLWGGDHDIEEEDDCYSMETTLKLTKLRRVCFGICT